LVPGRSVAVDKLHVYGTPFFIDATLPVESAKPTTPFRRLMIAQDTGSVIVRPARADLHWGGGSRPLGAGARRSLLARRRRCRPYRRPHPPSRPFRHAAAARARHGRG